MTTELTEATFDEFIENNNCVLIDCWAPWCGPCKRMGPVIDEISEELKGKVAVAKLNVDDAPGISARFQITAIPTLLMFKDKIKAEPLVGLRPKQDIIAYMASIGIIAEQKKEEPAEVHDYVNVDDASFDEFVKSKKFAVVDCWAPWCGPCRRMGPIIEKLAQISKDDIAVGKLNVDNNPMTSLKYNIQSIPMLLMYKDGKQIDVIVGLDPSLTAEKLRDHILGL